MPGRRRARTIANTACVVFNSRGIPIDADGRPYGNTAFYVTDSDDGRLRRHRLGDAARPPLVVAASQTAWVHK